MPLTEQGCLTFASYLPSYLPSLHPHLPHFLLFQFSFVFLPPSSLPPFPPATSFVLSVLYRSRNVNPVKSIVINQIVAFLKSLTPKCQTPGASPVSTELIISQLQDSGYFPTHPPTNPPVFLPFSSRYAALESQSNQEQT